MRVTMKDIAEATGTSVPTVSLILNGKPFRVSEETRQKVTISMRRSPRGLSAPVMKPVGVLYSTIPTISLIVKAGTLS